MRSHHSLKGIPRQFIACLLWHCVVMLVVCISTLTANAQSATATLSGTIVDQNGAVVPGVTVTVTNKGTAAQRQATTNDGGYFTIPLLPPSTYNVNTRRDGFSPVEVRDVVLNVGDQKALQIQLKAGDVNAQVTVNSDAEAVRTDGSVGTVVDRQFLANIPLNGRSFNALLELTPGIVLARVSNGTSGQFSVNGQRTNANYFSVDGVGANIGVTSGAYAGLGESGGGSLPPVSSLGGTNTLVSVDAVQEFRVETSSYAPEYGRSPGAQVSIVTRSGTNRFHGSAFDYVRNDVLDANDWFANSRGFKRAPERQNDFGGTFSGPVLLPRFGEGGELGYNGRDRTFFFFSYEGLRLRQPRTRLITVPSLAARQSATNSAIRAILNAFPLPNGRDFGNNTAEFGANFSNPSTINATSLRIDQSVKKRTQLFARYNNSPSHIYQQGAFDTYALSTNSTTVLNTQTFTVGATFTPTQEIVNDVRVNWSRVRGASIAGRDNFGGAVPLPDSLLIPPYASIQDSIVGIFPGNGIPNYVFGLSTDNKQRQLNIVENLSIAKGHHQLKFGIDYRRLSPTNGYRKNDFIYFLSSVSAAITTGNASRVIFTTTDAANLRPRFVNLSLFGQDIWRINGKLSLSYGLRWDYNPPPTEKTQGLFALTSLDNLSAVSLAPAGTPLWKASRDNFAPRFGIAYQISEKPGRELMLRGGGGIFYDLGNPRAAGALFAFPYSRSSIIRSVPLPGGLAQLAPIPFSLNPPFGSVSGMSDPRIKLPVTYQWNIAFEQFLGHEQSVTASYVAAAGRDLLITRSFSNPNPNFTTLGVTTNGGRSDYNAMQLQFQRRLSRGLQAVASYTWSHSIDIGSSDFFALDGLTSLNPNQERGNSDFDIRHAVTAGVTYNVPALGVGSGLKWMFRGWWLDSMFRSRSGAPVDVTSFRDVPPFGFLGLRPDVLPGVSLYLRDPAVAGGTRLNPAAFIIPTAPRQGTLARNALRGLSLWQWDLALRRQIDLTEKVNLQLRVEAFNIFNHPNFGNPVANLGGGQFGVSTAMFNQSLGGASNEGSFNPLYQIGGPRSLQIALKLAF